MVVGNPVIMKLTNSKFLGAGRPHEQAEKGAYLENSTAGPLGRANNYEKGYLKDYGQNKLAARSYGRILTSERYNKRAQ